MTTERKSQHLDIVLDGRAAGSGDTGLNAVRFAHNALPDLHMDAVDLSTRFLNRPVALPIFVSSMTGGPARAADINRNLAIACQATGVALAVGSQRVALEDGAAGGLDADLRRLAPDIPILANLGAAQMNLGYGVDHARRAVEGIGADALIIHLNPLQEALQPEGDRDWRDLPAKIGALARHLDVPLVVKEVGAGLSGTLARRLADEGVGIFDTAGSGGTSWAAVEAARNTDPVRAAIADAFADWGIPTATSIRQVRAACPDATVLASGGIATGLDVARAVRLGADMAGVAGAILPAAVQGPEAVADAFAVLEGQLRVACFCTGSRDLAALRMAELL
ncbi:type 2 isopentenyl-diphosphate Delta-isomerase [Falsirhodobacter halotolerans]|uniref:type 2 isopentenyl-diphosphate Delta-isomerase n=1 Tax=Falsirhodobacter halotolerans TaxID=1146892 RepID=UPI001FD0B79D|nr:type 2 isopentenyl-diphosphate Delta-isomerase [Falsirhodobacter halotolerans]MCJ8138924.1 type 2 isopentenyl-diphosphate Delta-isomerase [Falsirhodobacter halotolerans]